MSGPRDPSFVTTLGVFATLFVGVVTAWLGYKASERGSRRSAEASQSASYLQAQEQMFEGYREEFKRRDAEMTGLKNDHRAEIADKNAEIATLNQNNQRLHAELQEWRRLAWTQITESAAETEQAIDQQPPKALPSDTTQQGDRP